jgi:uncharacterized protein (DUF58 family)
MKRSNKARWLLLGAMTFLMFGWASTGVAIYIRLFLLLTLLLLGSFVWNSFAIQGIQIKRRSRSLRTSVGKVFDERFDVVNKSRWPSMWLEIEDLSALPQKSGSRILTGIGGMQQRSYTARTCVSRRGAFSLGPTLLSSGDLFGIFSFSRTELSENSLVVLPMTVDIPYFPSPEGIMPGGREIRKKTLDVTPHATGVRDYVSGDPMKRIHWPSTAKRNQFMVKIYEQDPQAEIWIFLDSQSNVQFSQESTDDESSDEIWGFSRRGQIKLPKDTYEYAISVASSLAKYFLQKKRAVGMVSSSSKFMIVPAERGERQIGKILETLAFLKADGSLPIMGCVALQAKYLPMGSGVLLITPSSANQEILMTIDDLKRRNLYPMIIQILADTFGSQSVYEQITIELELRNVPLYKIVYGENMEEQLSQIPVTFQKSWIPS